MFEVNGKGLIWEKVMPIVVPQVLNAIEIHNTVIPYI